MPITSIANARDVLTAFVATTWAAEAGGAPLLHDNLGATRPETPALFGRVVVRHADGENPFLGSSRGRDFGTLFVQLFAPEGVGTTALDVISDALVRALRSVGPGDLSGIRLLNISSTELGIDPSDRQYHQVNVSAAFSYDTFIA